MERLVFKSMPINRGKSAAKKWPCSRNRPSFQPRKKTSFMSAVYDSSTAKHLLHLVSRKNPEDRKLITELLDSLWKRSVGGGTLTGTDHEAIEAAQEYLREQTA